MFDFTGVADGTLCRVETMLAPFSNKSLIINCLALHLATFHHIPKDRCVLHVYQLRVSDSILAHSLCLAHSRLIAFASVSPNIADLQWKSRSTGLFSGGARRGMVYGTLNNKVPVE
jgi:hypothetical protein